MRDLFRCTKCGVDVSGWRQARVDHINPVATHPELVFELSNLRTLCSSCDNQAHREKGQKAAAMGRVEEIAIRGHDVRGRPLDPNHHWNKPPAIEGAATRAGKTGFRRPT